VKRKTEQLLAKAQEAIEAAELLLKGGKNDFAAGRAYAMFYTAEALLFEEGLEYRKHSGVHAAFGKHFVKTALLDAKFHRYFSGVRISCKQASSCGRGSCHSQETSTQNPGTPRLTTRPWRNSSRR